MIKYQQSLNEVAEMQSQIQETGEIMVYLTQVKQQKDISQINKQFQGTLMNKVIPKDLFDFFNKRTFMDKERYEKEMNQFQNKKEQTKYMQTFQVIYKLLNNFDLGQDYINLLLNFINRKPNYTKSNAVILMYRMRLTGIIMMEHYLKYKNAGTNLIDFNNVWNSLFSDIFNFTRKHSQQRINFAEFPEVASRCEEIIKKYSEEQLKYNESSKLNRQNLINPNKSLFRATGLQRNIDSSNSQSPQSTQQQNGENYVIKLFQ